MDKEIADFRGQVVKVFVSNLRKRTGDGFSESSKTKGKYYEVLRKSDFVL